MRSGSRNVQGQTLIILLIILTGALMGCGSGSGSAPAAAGTPVDQTDSVGTGTVVPTAPLGLPALAPNAGGQAQGFNVVLSADMTTPAAPGALVSPAPQPTGGAIIDRDAAIRLGKALFWDMQVGSDGQRACATCHFHAGADNRTINTINPGPNGLFDLVTGPGATFTPFTFDPAGFDDVVGSSGVISMAFTAISTDPNDPADVCLPAVHPDPAQQAIADAGERLVTGRNTPTTIGAVYYLDNLWDGRASHNFDGLNLVGTGTPAAGLSSLASQATDPPISDVEMSCAGRPWNGPESI